ncbi:FtsK/SpoIIIE domain-containing protein [Streptomyces massasporeus]|uniref:FtsK/SpoIIIE domain-containing protein n=1 Tax=Streptomyces massasporeus TaxID=67324 RepID=A0ABW6LF82_9ACTN
MFRPVDAHDHVTSPVEKVPSGSRARQALGTVCRLCGRLRYELIPAAATASMTCLGWLHHAVGVGPEGWGGYGLGLAAAGALTYGGLKFKNAPAASLGVASTGALVNTAVGAMTGPSVPSLIAGGVVTIASYGVYVPWLIKTRHERIALQIKAAKTAPLPDGMGVNVTQAGVTGDSVEETALRRALVALGVPAQDVSRIVFTDTGWHAAVTLPPGKNTSAETVIAKQTQLEANLDLPGKLRLAVGAQANQLIVRMQTNDPLAETIAWPGPAITSVEHALPIGIYPDGSQVFIDLVAGHVLIAGGTDMGKSGVINCVIGNLVACEDAEILGIDMKPGALELGPWRRNMLALADDADGARQVLTMVKAEMIRRGKYLATLRGPKGEPVRKWTSEHGPYWILVVDELAELLRQAPDVASELVTINQVARAMGIRVIAATQSPSEQAFGGKGTDARQQYSTRIGLPVFETEPINMIFGRGAYGRGWRLDWLDLPGKVMVSSRRYADPREGRCYYVTDRDIVVVSTEHARHEDEEPAEPAWPHPQHEPDPDPEPPTPPPGSGGGGPRGGRPHLRPVPTFPDGSRIPDNRIALWEALQKAGPDGVTKPELVADDIVGHGSSATQPLTQWTKKGWLDDSGKRGQAKVWRLVAVAHTPRPEVTSTDEENSACPASL